MNKIKHKYIFYPVLIVLALISGSCDDFLDETPDNRTVIDTNEKITKLLVSAYPETSYCYLAELASDNVDDNGSSWTAYDRLQTQTYSWADITEIGTDSPQELWDACYKAIATANQALEAIEESDDQENLSAQKGEALLCRAFGHFVLVNIFSKAYRETASYTDLGIPYIEKPETTVFPQYDRSTVANVYQKIEADIEAALPLVNDNIYEVPKYHFNKKAAYAFAARFNLYYRKYDRVIEYAGKALGNNPSSVLRDWQYAATLSQNDDMRGNEFISAENRATLLLVSAYSIWGRIHGPYSSGSKYTHNRTISNRETTGSTGPWGSYTNFYYQYASYTSIPKVVIRKINEYFEYTDPVNGIGFAHIIHPVFTTDETLLCRAEAYVFKNEYDKATADLSAFLKAYSAAGPLTRQAVNDFYSGIAYYTPTEPTVKKELHPDFTVEAGEQENFVQCILHMRRILTIHEGLRWFDIKRYGIQIYRRTVENNIITVTDELPADDPRRAIQLPQDVISAGLKANPR
jgi:tetratricopeptide (TPR) repeat protein